jgi:hypothetical protein
MKMYDGVDVWNIHQYVSNILNLDNEWDFTREKEPRLPTGQAVGWTSVENTVVLTVIFSDMCHKEACKQLVL